jgi:O-antigen/teichoic acid export membrane protein
LILKQNDGGPIKTFGWQLAKAVLAAVVVIVYSRGMGAYGRGVLSILLLNLQMTLMVSELLSGGALANLLAKYPAKRILPTAWTFLMLVLGCGYLVGWYQFVLPNQGDLPLNFDHPRIILLNLLFFQGLFLGSLSIQFNVFQVKGWIQQRNQLQLALEVLKLLGLALCFEAMYGFVFPKISAVELSARDMVVPVGQTTHYVHGFDEMAVLWVLVYASGLVCVMSAFYLWRKGAFQDKGNSEGQTSSIRPPKEMFESGVFSQTGHILLFLLYRLPLWWMAADFGNAEAGVLANALLMADTIWIFGNSFGTILHSRMLRLGGNRKKFSRLLAMYVLYSGLGTLCAILMAALLPKDLYTWVFGETFTTLKETFVLLSPAVLFLGISAPMGHYLHAQNRFKALILSYGLAVAVLFAGWTMMDVYVASLTSAHGILSGIERYIQSYLGKLMVVNLAFLVLLLLNCFQVRKDIKWRGIWLLMRRLYHRKTSK